MSFSEQISFAGKKVLVTGGGRALGKSIVERLYKDGAIVFTVEKLPDLVEDLKKEFPKITAVQLDITDFEKTKTVVESFGPMDLLVNNAGIYLAEEFLDVTIDVMNLIIDLNWKALLVVSQTVAKGMVSNKTGGAIVNISSLASRRVSPGMSVYGSSKAAVTMLTKAMAIELGPHNIRVNCIAPGGIDPPRQNGAPLSPLMANACKVTMQRSVIKEMIPPSQVVDLIYFLLSPLSSMITGEEVFIDAGATIT